MSRSVSLTLFCLSLASFASHASGDNWPGWRGPNSNGTANGKHYPQKWNKEKNIAWKFDLPGVGGSTPAVWEDRIFVTSGDGKKNRVICLNRKGERLWERKIGNEVTGKHKKGSGSNPSPTTDGEHVFVYFKSGDFACLDFQGNLVWQHNLQEMYGKDTLWWDLGTSPVLTSQHIVVTCMQTGPSYLVAFNKQTGEVVWKHDRDTGAPVEAAQSYSTPMVVEHEGRETIVVLGADFVTAHDARTGSEIWRAGTLNPEGNKFFRSIASPVIDSGIVVAPYARGATLTAIRLGGSGNVTDSHIAWSKNGTSSDVPTPAAKDGRVYVLTDKGLLACLDVKTGASVWEHRFQRNRNAYSASPVVVDGKIYVTREDGKTFVLKDGSKPELLASNEIDEFTVATPVFTDGKILLRTAESLYCVGE